MINGEMELAVAKQFRTLDNLLHLFNSESDGKISGDGDLDGDGDSGKEVNVYESQD